MRLTTSIFLCAAMLVTAIPAFAGDGVATSGLLSDTQLYRSMACGAAPGKACQQPFVRWQKPTIRVVFECDTGQYPKTLASVVKTALNLAINSLNAVGSAAKLRLVTDHADVLVLCTNLAEGDLTKGIPNMTDGQSVGEAFTQINWGADHALTSATIIVSNTITPDVLRSVILEELFQSLGFPFDVENPAYEGASILSQTSDATTAITGQDAAVLRLHYPPN